MTTMELIMEITMLIILLEFVMAPIMMTSNFAICVQFKPKAAGWMHHLISPEDLMMQLFSLQRQRTTPERNDENSAAGREILELMLTFNANSDGSSDGDS